MTVLIDEGRGFSFGGWKGVQGFIRVGGLGGEFFKGAGDGLIEGAGFGGGAAAGGLGGAAEMNGVGGEAIKEVGQLLRVGSWGLGDERAGGGDGGTEGGATLIRPAQDAVGLIGEGSLIGRVCGEIHHVTDEVVGKNLGDVLLEEGGEEGDVIAQFRGFVNEGVLVDDGEEGGGLGEEFVGGVGTPSGENGEAFGRGGFGKEEIEAAFAEGFGQSAVEVVGGENDEGRALAVGDGDFGVGAESGDGDAPFGKGFKERVAEARLKLVDLVEQKNRGGDALHGGECLGHDAEGEEVAGPDFVGVAAGCKVGVLSGGVPFEEEVAGCDAGATGELEEGAIAGFGEGEGEGGLAAPGGPFGEKGLAAAQRFGEGAQGGRGGAVADAGEEAGERRVGGVGVGAEAAHQLTGIKGRRVGMVRHGRSVMRR